MIMYLYFHDDDFTETLHLQSSDSVNTVNRAFYYYWIGLLHWIIIESYRIIVVINLCHRIKNDLSFVTEQANSFVVDRMVCFNCVLSYH